MLKRYATIGFVSALSILSLSSAAFAGQGSYQSVSGSTRASGEDTTAISHTQQSVSQWGGGTQYLWQSIDAGTSASGQGTTATTHVTQAATQAALDEWADDQTHLMLQSAGISTTALGDWSSAENTTGQYSSQGWTDY